LLDIYKYIDEISKRNYSRVVIEFSEGFYSRAIEFYRSLKERIRDIDIILNDNPRYGSCDIDINFYLQLNPDIIIHIGHNPYPYYSRVINKLGLRVHYIPYYIKIDDEGLKWIKDVVSVDDKLKIGLAASIQYLPSMYKVYRQLNRNNTFLIKLPGLPHGQIIGCLSRALYRYTRNLDKIYFIGGGKFHALGLALYSGKPTFLLDIHRKNILSLETEVRKFKSLVMWNIYRAMDSKVFGIIAGKSGLQNMVGRVNTIKNLLDRHGKKYVTLYLDRFDENILDRHRDLDAFIAGSCPRIAIDDITRVKKPILNLEQLLILFGYKKFEEVYPNG